MFTEWATPDHTSRHVPYSSGVTIWQRVLRSDEHFEHL